MLRAFIEKVFRSRTATAPPPEYHPGVVAPGLRTKRDSLDLLADKGFNASIVVDVGAYTDTSGLYDTWPKAHFVMIEPVRSHEPALVALCARLHSAEYMIAAAGNTAGQLKLASNPQVPMETRPWDAAPDHWARFTVPMVTVDSIVARARLHHPGSALIKIDVDGSELSVLEGCVQSLAAGQDAVLIEAALLDTDRGRFGEIVAFMVQRGYEVFDIIEPLERPIDNVLWQVDLLFVPRDFVGRSSRKYE